MRCYYCSQELNETNHISVGNNKAIHYGCYDAYKQHLKDIVAKMNEKSKKPEVF